jgi:hypothetical protein
MNTEWVGLDEASNAEWTDGGTTIIFVGDWKWRIVRNTTASNVIVLNGPQSWEWA